ncbi:hypothetical protein [Streptomyces chrestomyceticus]|uniref:hypothetical protein n=1 Tax=Streptomyces chrestomyceticus TaxID=68185 RepID=UPI00340E9226
MHFEERFMRRAAVVTASAGLGGIVLGGVWVWVMRAETPAAVRRLVRRRTTALVQPPVWERDGHFRVGDAVHTPPDRHPLTVTWVQGRSVGLLTNPRNNSRMHTAASDLRHLSGCAPCMADAADQAAAEEQRQAAYWAQWPADDHELYEALMDDQVLISSEPHRRYRFGDASPVREWMRTELDGHLLDDEMPSLTLGRVWDPVDWPRIEDDHGADGLTIENPWRTPAWAAIRAAFEILRDAGYTPALDASVEMERLADKTVGANVVVSGLQVEGLIDDATYQQVAALLGEATDWPQSHMYYPMRPDGPGLDRSQPYKVDEFTATGWRWT